jgi:hypothetical protein
MHSSPMPQLCQKKIPSRSKYDLIQPRLCQHLEGHSGPCNEFPYLRHLNVIYPTVADKIIRDSVMTTGAAWKSKEAGPNRILRWVMLLSDEALLELGIDMNLLKPQVVAKLREKAAPYDDCMNVGRKLAWWVYGMPDAPTPDDTTRAYLEAFFGPIPPQLTTCLICKAPLPFPLFLKAARGKAEIETGHSNPRMHNQDNVGFAHRECNIAQGSKTLAEFYRWIAEILVRVGHQSS